VSGASHEEYQSMQGTAYGLQPADRYHIDQITEMGFTVIPNVLQPRVLEELRAALDRLVTEDPGVHAKLSQNPNAYYVENLPNKGRVFENFFLVPQVLAIVAQFVGPSFTANELWATATLPGGYTGSHNPLPGRYHCDKELCLPDYVLSIQCAFPLSDMTYENGATRIVPSSHRSGTQPPEGIGVFPDELPIQASAGSCAIFLSHLWHRSGPNQTSSLRAVLWAQFQRPWLKPYIDYPRTLRPEVLARATDEALRIYGFHWRTPFTERWMWDMSRGVPRPEYREVLAERFGHCCLGPCDEHHE
jgi:ectoine hydroxylase-related dioxygenase (phytanoyl-CoA dioxygenase family)